VFVIFPQINNQNMGVILNRDDAIIQLNPYDCFFIANYSMSLNLREMARNWFELAQSKIHGLTTTNEIRKLDLMKNVENGLKILVQNFKVCKPYAIVSYSLYFKS